MRKVNKSQHLNSVFLETDCAVVCSGRLHGQPQKQDSFQILDVICLPTSASSKMWKTSDVQITLLL